MTDELEDLDTLLGSPGWARVQAQCQAEWGRTGTRYLDLLEKMANTQDRVQAADEIQRVIWVRKEIEAFFASVVSRHQHLKNQRVPQESGVSRRGVL